ncbi:MAG: CBS domain-containing protein [Solirubrobacterales bacterium]|nr:CBS domain-containing protein [Solirubrobacterales bacterium]
MEIQVGMSEVVLRIGPGLSLREAASRMSERGIGAAIVEDDEWPVPRVLTERDLLNAIGSGLDPDSELVRDHMSEKVITASPDWSMERAATEMSKRGIRHLVVCADGELVGVLSMRDIMRAWTSDGATSGGPPDRQAA